MFLIETKYKYSFFFLIQCKQEKSESDDLWFLGAHKFNLYITRNQSARKQKKKKKSSRAKSALNNCKWSEEKLYMRCLVIRFICLQSSFFVCLGEKVEQQNEMHICALLQLRERKKSSNATEWKVRIISCFKYSFLLG